MTTADSGTDWAKTGAIISPVKAVSTDVYPNDLAKRKRPRSLARSAVVGTTAPTLLPGGGPDMGAELQNVIQGRPSGTAAPSRRGMKSAWDGEK